MRLRVFPVLGLLAVFSTCGIAQTEIPADQKAYTTASRTMDPAKKLEALEKFKTDFPKSDMRSSADSVILTTLVKNYPDQKGRIMKQAKAMYAGAEAREKGSIANSIANDFLESGHFLSEAEHYAKAGVADMQEARYARETRENAEKRKQKAPSDDEIAKRYREARAVRIGTLGRVEVARGQTARGQKLLEEAWAANKNLVPVQATLGELAYKAGDDEKAMELLLPARLSGRAPASANLAMESLYKKQHNGSVEGFDAMLDAQYRKLYPNPVKVEEYHPTEKRSDRLVLAEVFTGAGCPPCVAADLAFDAAMERYSRKDLVVVMYHEHVPRPDPLTNADTVALSKAWDIHGVPSYAVDGKLVSGGGGSRDYTKTVYDRIVTPIEKDLELPAEAKLSAQASINGNTVKVSGSVEGLKEEADELEVRTLLVEKQIRYTGENGIRFHPMVVRAIHTEKAGGAYSDSFNVDEVSAAIHKHLDEYEAGGHRGETFKFSEKKYAIDHTNLAVVVMVRNSKTKHVLQSAIIDLSTGHGQHLSTETK